MTEGTPKSIEMKGIVRNATKIGVQDGQAEDLLNLRLMDGSWRTSGDGRHVYSMTENAGSTAAEKTYTQLFIHTNVYRHLLGVRNVDGVDKLFWFASIDTDGVTFRPLKSGNSSSEDAFIKTLPDAPVELTTVHGDLWITQTGHLLTVIDGEDDFEYFVFKTDTKNYKGVELDVNGKPSDRTIYPYGHIYFNLHKDADSGEYDTIDVANQTDEQIATMCNEKRITLQGKVQKKNKFNRPFLAIGAIELYDGSYMYASAPQLLFPSQNAAPYYKNYYNKISGGSGDGAPNKISVASGSESYAIPGQYIWTDSQNNRKTAAASYNNPQFCAGGGISTTYNENVSTFAAYVPAFDLVCSVENIEKILQDNKELFLAFCIFITPEQDICKNEKGTIKDISGVYVGNAAYSNYRIYEPELNTLEEVKYNLLHSNFYLLKRYTTARINELASNNIVDLSHPEDKEIVNLIDIGNGGKILDIESANRQSYIPKVAYMYNNKLHIANYLSRQFDGYPIDLFLLNNYTVENTSVRNDNFLNKVIPSLTNDFSYVHQWDKQRYSYIDSNISSEVIYYGGDDRYIPYPDGLEDAIERIQKKDDVLLSIEVEIDTGNYIQKVLRYIKAFLPTPPVDWYPSFIEDLSPLLSFPDSRAKKMTIKIMRLVSSGYGDVYYYSKEFELTPHPYLDMAFYMSDDLKPISIQSMYKHTLNYDQGTELDKTGTIDLQSGKGILQVYLKGIPDVDYDSDSVVHKSDNEFSEERVSNGLKVSKTDNPIFFPVENTYRVGSAEILALCSNAIAVGTGQTGAAPLYVFCTDGVYALFVDASGQMTYTNARVIARDVCNNPRSVTPTDLGVVFTTDRGLMRMAGEQVEEIGSLAEGDVVQFWNAGSVDYSKIATAAMQQIAGLPSNLCSTTDFLTYLQDKGTSGKAAIINYNHNMRELMVSNPNYPYSYVLDREGNWSRRDYTAAQYVNNYPTSYRVDKFGHFYKVDDEGDANTTLEHRKEADNKIFYLSNVIKLDSIGFKQAYRFVVRGYFETMDNENIACVVEGSYDGRKFKPLGYNRKSGKFRDIGCIVERTDVRFYRVCLSGQVTGKTRIDYMEMSAGASMLNTKIR